MKTFKQWLLVERKVELVTCTKKMVEIPKGKSEKEFLAKRFVKGSKK
jgi:hypothetical protein